MLQYDVIPSPGHLLIAVVVSVVTDQRECVALIHPYMTEGLERVAGLVKIGAVTIKTRPLMGEVHLPVEDGGIGIQSLIVMEHVGMDEVDAGVLGFGPAGRALGLPFLGIGIKAGVTHQHTQQAQQI